MLVEHDYFKYLKRSKLLSELLEHNGVERKIFLIWFPSTPFVLKHVNSSADFSPPVMLEDSIYRFYYNSEPRTNYSQTTTELYLHIQNIDANLQLHRELRKNCTGLKRFPRSQFWPTRGL